ncbi:MAG: hypothetical protein K8R28_07690 [Desulfobacterales bacterium]|nr:hypothetical protein [Desulfobacterales bacterium]
MGDTELARVLKQGMALITQEERAAIERKWLKASTIKTRDVLNIALDSDFAPFTFFNWSKYVKWRDVPSKKKQKICLNKIQTGSPLELLRINPNFKLIMSKMPIISR